MKRKKYKDMTPEEQYKEDMRRAERDNRQARIIALVAIAVSLIMPFVKAFLEVSKTIQ